MIPGTLAYKHHCQLAKEGHAYKELHVLLAYLAVLLYVQFFCYLYMHSMASMQQDSNRAAHSLQLPQPWLPAPLGCA